MVLLYQTDQFQGELKSSDEGAVCRVDNRDILNLHLAPDMEDIWKVFYDETLGEFFYYREHGNWKHVLK